MRLDEVTEVEVEELVAVEDEDRLAMLTRSSGEAQASPTSQRLRLSDSDHLESEAAERALERLLVARRTAHDHPLDAGAPEECELVRGQGPAGDRHERFRLSLGSVAEPLGLSTGENDRFPRHLQP
jgi:hypothetical protein